MINEIKEINDDLTGHDWTKLEKLNVNEAFNNLHDKLTKAIDEYAPEKVHTVKYKRPYNPLLSLGIHKCMKKQKLLYRASLKSKTDQIALSTRNTSDVSPG